MAQKSLLLLQSKQKLPKKRLIRLFLLVFLLFITLASGTYAYSLHRADLRFVSQLGVGWNLGNTLDAHGLNYDAALPHQYETYWGSPYTTKEMIAEIRKAGFKTLRVPVSWYEHLDEQQQIDPLWLERVRQVVEYGLENDMFVILNAHHDAWYTPDPSNLRHAEAMMRTVWQQIAEYFAGFDERLLFESMNEPRLIGTEFEWNEGTSEARTVVNRLNEVFVEVIRSASGYNATRYLLLPTYCASIHPAALAAFRLPKSDRLIVSLHLYRPYSFTLDENGSQTWSSRKRSDTYEINEVMRNAFKRFTRRGIPVIITEFGAVDKNNEGARAQWARYVRTAAEKRNIPIIWWDNSVLDRSRLVWNYPEIIDALLPAP